MNSLEKKDSLPQLSEEERIARLMDSAFKIPGLNIKFGLDPLIGLIPGGGDLISIFLSLWIIWRLKKKGVSNALAFEMLSYLVADTVIGTLPLLGDILDLNMKANERNIMLAKKYFEKKAQEEGEG